MTNGASKRVQQIFSPGEKVLTKTGKPFVIEEIGAERIRFRLLASDRRMSLKQSRLALVIDNFEQIRNSDNLARAVRDVLKKSGDAADSTNEPYLYGLAQEFLKRQVASTPKAKRPFNIVRKSDHVSGPPKSERTAVSKKTRTKAGISVTRHTDPRQFEFTVRTREMVRKGKKIEDALVKEYREWLIRQGHHVDRIKYDRLQCDAYDNKRNNLIEAKSSIKREYIRMAVGQLLDYAFLGRKAFKTPGMAILLPRKPELDILAWLDRLKIKVIWKQRKAFVDNAQGRFT